jgi:Concanavalin A-like lectin/glucanases superfamily
MGKYLDLTVPWTTQPQYPVGIDRSNPLGSRARSVFSGSTKSFDHASRRLLTATETGTITYPVGPYGIELLTPNGSFIDLPIGFSITSSYTIFFVAKINSIDSPWGGVFAKLTSGTTGQITFGRYDSSSNFYIGHDDALVVQLTSSSITTGSYKTYAITFDGTTATYYENGVVVQTLNPGTPSAGSGGLILGASRDGTSTYDSDINWMTFQIYGANIGQSGVTGLHKNHWQIFEPIPSDIYIPSAGGGATESDANSSGVATVTGISGSTAGSVGASSGVATTSGIASATVLSTGSSNGVATAAGIAASVSISVGSSNGVAVTSGIAAGVAASVAASVGVASTSGIASSIFASVASSTGVATAQADAENAGTGGNIIESTAESSGSSMVLGVSGAIAGCVANSEGFATCLGESNAVVDSTAGGGIGHGGKKKKFKTSHKLWVVKVDNKEYEVDDLTELTNKVIKKSGKQAVIKAKPLTNDPREAAEIYAKQLALTAYVPIPAYDNRLNLVDVTAYLVAMMEMEEEEEPLLLLAA